MIMRAHFATRVARRAGCKAAARIAATAPTGDSRSPGGIFTDTLTLGVSQ